MSAIDTLARAFQIDVTAVFLVVGVFQFSNCRIIGSMTDSTLLATSEDLEGIASVEVDGGRAPNLRLLTIAAAKHVERLTQHVHTLFVEENTRTTLKNMIAILSIENGLTLVLFYLVEDGISTFAVL